MQAENVDDEKKKRTRNSSPAKRLTEQTTTITVPLKGGDDSPPAAAKKARGRPRTSMENEKKRDGTRKPKAGGRRSTLSDSRAKPAQHSKRGEPSPPKKSKGRPRKSMEPASEGQEESIDSGLRPGHKEDKLEHDVTGRKTLRTRNRGRRKEISPVKIALDSEAGSEQDTSRIADGMPIDSVRTPSGVGNHAPLRPELPTPVDYVDLQAPLNSPGKLSIMKQQGEDVWRSMIHFESPSNFKSPRETQDEGPVDPTDEHHEYDTILESEGFSMVSVSSLASTGGNSNPPINQAESMSERTPAIASSPSVPPSIRNDSVCPSPRQMIRSQDGTPKLARVVHAGIALQGVLSTRDPRRRLGSPFAQSAKPEPSQLNASQLALSEHGSSGIKARSPEERLDELFGGFGAGTRRELRAGLRLGEELAKRQRETASTTDEDVFGAASGPWYPRLSGSHAPEAYNLKVSNPKQEQALEITYPSLSRKQLPTPERSEDGVDDDHMSWNEDTPAKPLESITSTSSDPLNHTNECDNESTVDHTMMAREAGWQRERQAVSRQIELANKSQVIVINSDDDEADPRRESSENEDDIWQAEAHTQTNSREPTPEVSNLLAQPENVKPRRSKLPSPWTRRSEIIQSSEIEPIDADLFWQSNQTQPKLRKGLFGKDNESQGSRDQSWASSSPVIEKSPDASARNPKNPSLKSTTISREATNEESVDQTDDSTSALLASQLHTVREPRSRPSHSSGSAPAAEKSHITQIVQRQAKQKITVEEQVTRLNGPIEEVSEDSTLQSVDEQSIGTIPEVPRDTIKDLTAAIDPLLLRNEAEPKPAAEPSQRQKQSHHAPLTLPTTTIIESSWLTRLTAPIWSALTPSLTLPPPATKSDILTSSPHEPLCQLTPWEPCHTRALGPLYYSALLYGAHIFPFNPSSASATYLNATIRTPLGWERKVMKQDCAVADAFMVLLDERGFALGSGVVGERWIEESDVVGMCVELWVGMVMRGEVEVGGGAGKGEKVGLRKQGDRLWTREDVDWSACSTRYFERKRRQFDGLPSWKELGWKRVGEGWVLGSEGGR